MDQIKIGKFIAETRKKKNMTQLQLAEKLGITDRAVSKWENGKTMPDSAIMLELCDALHISVNDLLNGEVVSPEDYNRKLEEQLVELASGKEQSDRLLMRVRRPMFLCLLITSFSLGLINYFIEWSWLLFICDHLSDGIFLYCIFTEARILQQAGYFRCSKCGKVYTPPYGRMVLVAFWSVFRNPRFRCSCCGKRAKHVKVFTKE